MATDVRVEIRDATIISALNTPGGAVFRWRDETEEKVLAVAYATSPVNDPLNALHRGGVVGEFKQSWVTRRYGNQHRVGFAIENFSDHADIVEFGRFRSFGHETFAWTEHTPPGEIDTHPHGTAGRLGRHVLQRAVNSVMPAATGGTFTPL